MSVVNSLTRKERKVYIVRHLTTLATFAGIFESLAVNIFSRKNRKVSIFKAFAYLVINFLTRKERKDHIVRASLASYKFFMT